MKQFLITFAAVIAAGIVLTVIPFLIFTVMATAAFMAGSSTKVEQGTILKLNLTEAISDRSMDTPANRARAYVTGDDPTAHGLNTLRDALSDAANDDNIAAIMITGSYVNATWTDMRDIRRALQEFKEECQKPIYYYGNNMVDGVAYVASIADSAFVTPGGSVMLTGCMSSKVYFKKMADKFGIGFDVIKHGKYKAAVEPYFRDSMSPEDREQTMRYLNVVWSEIRDTIAAGRGIKAETIDAYVDELKGLRGNVTAAVQTGLIDAEAYYDQFEDKLRNLTGLDAEKDPTIVNIFDYAPESTAKLNPKADKVAIVYALGQIYDGKSNGDDANIYGQDLAATLRKLRKDKDIKAVVMRVSSPGGSASASDIIWREVDLLRQEKPVVVSMGSYAASGGYYISCAANHIVAEPNTITGSIGVFGVVPNAGKLTSDLGISLDVASTSKTPLVTGFAPLSEPVFQALSESVEETYKRFVDRVCQGRDMTFEAVDSIGGGHVWAGADAVNIGLVDRLGNLDDAIDMAAEEAGLADDFVTEDYPKLDDSMTAVMKQLGLSVRTSIGNAILGPEFQQFEKMKQKLESPEGFVWAVCDMEVK